MPKDQSTEDRIKDAAKSIFVQKGYAGARMQEIAEEAGGINKALLHYYFRSKDQLFEKIFEEVFQEIMPKLNAVLNLEGSVLEKIDAFVDEYISNIRRHPHIPLFVIHELSQNPDRFVQKVTANPGLPNVARLMMEIMEAMERKEIRTFVPMHLFMNILSMCVFPFVARPIIQSVTQMDDLNWDQMMDDRAEMIKRFIHAALEVE
ncbi:TetR/AcrR family transcriptional regulator [Flavilitoribacter nigricans]|uniref:TetR family transcriptional regulator n=1 Tax=Flavilitoribacter nigricans (strain ATCC 23147 / DSM 23189 / NBRC 102662 / NCIMB 1420 / SS-2) TaxID=1122177 RepID=A0A2D0N3V9_FLAN2|nr:TetR/AcrR family transcriptional regulator [Flavilitoribacter nigricans]PHN03211.1 TetR family transcriptional regulator [Flavilitoribacter nigricans DSM 23189 = NBRC 102662]